MRLGGGALWRHEGGGGRVEVRRREAGTRVRARFRGREEKKMNRGF